MKHLAYTLIKCYIRAGLYLYFKKIYMHGIGDLPWGKPLLLLPNHQNALLDPLIIAAYAPRKPFFLTRSDVFVNPLITWFFGLLQMLPVYRIRDGRDTLARNSAIFDQCSGLLAHGETVVMFPEANHNLQRRVRPLSKGFTRILFHALEKFPEASINLVPVGINYVHADGFPDSVAYYFGSGMEASQYYDPGDLRNSSLTLKATVSDQLKKLTTHVPEKTSYEETIGLLDSLGVNYLYPKDVNAVLAGEPQAVTSLKNQSIARITGRVADQLFFCVNLAAMLLWRGVLKPKIGEPEFTSTYRFLYTMVVYPLFYAVFFLLFVELTSQSLALALLSGHILFNLFYVKLR